MKDQQRCTASDLVDAARAQSTPVSARLIDDYVAKGLLAAPLKKGLGRGRGTIATWPGSQRRLFLDLLIQRHREVKRISTLCNIPVWLWLRAGEDEYPLMQVRRALATWARDYRRSSVRRTRYSAEQLVEDLGSPEATQRDVVTFINTMIEIGARGKFDRDRMRRAARRIANPTEDIPDIETVLHIEAVLDLIQLRYGALESIPHIDDGALRSIRIMFLQARGTLPMRETSEEVQDACLDVVTLYGMHLHELEEHQTG